MDFQTDKFHLERTMMEFIEKEIEVTLKKYKVYATIDGRRIEIDHGDAEFDHGFGSITINLKQPFTYY